MPLVTGEFAISTTAAPTTQDVTGLGFKPDWVIFLYTKRTTDGIASENCGWGMGLATAADVFAMAMGLPDGSADRAGNRHSPDDCIIDLDGTDFSGAGDLIGSAQLNSFLADGFRLDIDDTFAAAYDIMYLAGAGLGIPKIVSFDEPASTGTQDITGFGFRPGGGIILSAGRTGSAESGGSNPGSVTVGAWDRNGNEGVVCIKIVGWSGGAGNTNRYSYSGECYAQIESSTTAQNVEARAAFDSVLSDGVRIDWLERSVTGRTAWMICWPSDAGFHVGKWATRTDGTNIVTTGVGFRPEALFMFSHMDAEEAQDTPRQTGQVGVGFGTGPSSRFSAAVSQVDGNGNSNTGSGKSASAVYGSTNTWADAWEGQADIVTLDADGYTTVMDDPDPGASNVFTVSFASAIGGAQAMVIA